MRRNKHPDLMIFDIVTKDEELAEAFNSFFYVHDLLSLVTDARRGTSIKVTDAEARAVVNPGGAYHEDFKQFRKVLKMATDNKKYQEAVFSVVEGTKSVQKLANNIRIINSMEQNKIKDKHKHNTWNIVFYNTRF